MWRFRTSDQAGFTLLEVMVAVAIIALALVAALGSQSQGLTLASETKFATSGAFLAQAKMAELEAIAPDELSSDSGDFGDDYPGYQWKTDVTEGVPSEAMEKAAGHLKKVMLTVFRPDVGGYEYRFIYYRFSPNMTK